MPASIPKPELVAALNSLAEDLGRPPTRSEMESKGEYSATPYYRQFGSWSNALRNANLKPQYRQQIPNEELLAALTELADELGHSPRPKDMAANGPFSPSTYRRRFDSWKQALENANLTINSPSKTSQISREDLLAELYRLTHTLGRPPTQSDIETDGEYSVDTYHDQFGSWTAALEEANLQLG